MFLCDPNNPTGRLMDGAAGPGAVPLPGGGGLLAVDQCFLELTGGDPHRLTEQLSGAGYSLPPGADQELCPWRACAWAMPLCGEEALLDLDGGGGPPWAVSVLAQAAGEIALQQFSRWPKDSLGAIRRGREQLAAGLTGLGLWVCPGDGNFPLFPGPEGPGQAAAGEGAHPGAGLLRLLRAGARLVPGRGSGRREEKRDC